MHLTPAFSGHATLPTSKFGGPGLAQLSPALCNVAITLIEHSWHQLHNNLLQHTALHFSYYRYVDNRFIVHNEHFLPHPAIQTLIHTNFFGDPVELETVEDYHLLGFNIDLQQRTITYIQPAQPWKIRDHTSAGSQRLALSGLASRLHSIYTYTFPPHLATAAAEALVNLYAQKGHDLQACRRFLRGKEILSPPLVLCADHGVLCVSHPGSKGFPPCHLFTFPPPAGGMAAVSLAMPTKLWDSVGRECGRTFLYLRPKLFSTL